MAGHASGDPYRSFDDLASEIPRYESFFSVAEHRRRDERLAADHDHVSFEVLGESSDGNEIWSTRVGEGPHTAFMFAAPHPNEPIGSMTIDFLSRRLAEDDDLRRSFDYEFVFVKTADVDGTLLNQGWFDGPFTTSNYAQNFYRPASDEQVEWTFPLEYEGYEFDDPLPETEMLMEAIAEHEPDFVYSLHNAGFGGCYYYVSRELPVFEELRSIARDHDVPLDLGEPEAPWMEAFGDAVFRMPSATRQYDYLADNTDRDPAEMLDSGAGSLDFARKHNPDVVELVTELPYFYDPQIASDETTDRSRREVVLDGVDRAERLVAFLAEQYDRVADDLPDSRLKRAVEETVEKSADRLEAKRTWAETEPDLDEPATVAQTVDALTVRPFYRMLSFGTFLRVLDHAAMSADEASTDVEELEAVKAAVERRFHDVNADLLEDLDYRAIPIRRLVAIQARAGLVCLDHLQRSNHFE
ncbi:M14 family metallopeptidase [Halorussus halobius]|uniref:peptidase M14 n=1 Tax=Halorussus halobius TaxID=1710537 RepID=UPI00109276A6|nr:peptidase M14 [Halorussus halobius]